MLFVVADNAPRYLYFDFPSWQFHLCPRQTGSDLGLGIIGYPRRVFCLRFGRRARCNCDHPVRLSVARDSEIS